MTPRVRVAAARPVRAVVRAALVVGVLLGLLVGTAAAERLVLVDVPAPVEAALRVGLAPWAVEVVVAPSPAAVDPAGLAVTHGAAFVVWRRGDALVLYDAALAAEERRPLPAVLDDATAAAVALSIRTWMGLGPPADGEPGCPPAGCARRARPGRWLVEAAIGVRVNPVGQGGAGFRYGVAAGLRRGRFEGGLRVELGVDASGTGFGRLGTWSLTTAGGWARAGFEVAPALTLGPGVGVGLSHARFVAPRAGPGLPADDGASTTWGLDAELDGRWARGRISAGGQLGVTLIPGAQRLRSRSLEHVIPAHVEPWLRLTVVVAF